MSIRCRIGSLALLCVLGFSMVGWAAVPSIQWYEHEDEIDICAVLEMENEYWLVGTNVSSLDPPDAGIVVFRIQPDGSLSYPVSYDWEGVQSAADATLLPSGDVIFAGKSDAYGAVGSDMYVLRVDRAGQTLSEWVYGDALEEFATRIFVGSHGDYFVVGNQMNPDAVIADAETPGYGGLEGRTGPYIARVQSNGQTVWERDYASEDNVIVVDAVPSDTGGCLVLSTVYGFPNAADAIRLVRVDETGDIMWSRTFDQGSCRGYSMLQLDGGWLLIAGARVEDTGRLQAFMMMLTATGREVWTRTYGDPEMISALHTLTETSDGRFVAAGTQFAACSQDQDDIYLVCVDADGEVQWEQTHATGKQVRVEALRELSDGGLLIAGSGAAAGQRFQAMLLRVEPQAEADGP